MSSRNALISTAIGSLLALGALNGSAAEQAAATEKCYGVAKAGKNDCAARGHACSGLAKVDRDPQEYINVPKGTCDKIAGGSTTPK